MSKPEDGRFSAGFWFNPAQTKVRTYQRNYTRTRAKDLCTSAAQLGGRCAILVNNINCKRYCTRTRERPYHLGSWFLKSAPILLRPLRDTSAAQLGGRCASLEKQSNLQTKLHKNKHTLMRERWIKREKHTTR